MPPPIIDNPPPTDLSQDYWKQFLDLTTPNKVRSATVEAFALTLEQVTVQSFEHAAKKLQASAAEKFGSAVKTLEARAAWANVQTQLTRELGVLLNPQSILRESDRVLVRQAIFQLQETASILTQATFKDLRAKVIESFAKQIGAVYYGASLLFKLKSNATVYEIGKASVYALVGIGVGVAATAVAGSVIASLGTVAGIAAVTAGAVALTAGVTWGTWKIFEAVTGISPTGSLPFWDSVFQLSPSELLQAIEVNANAPYESRRNALFGILRLIDSTTSSSDFAEIANASGIARPKDSQEERMLAALLKLFLGPTASSLNIADEDSFLLTAQYLAKDIVTRFGSSSPLRVVKVVDGLTPSQLALARESGGVAFRYALKELSPFVIVGLDAVYSQHNSNGELDIYNPTNQSGAITEQWVTDRADFHKGLNVAFTNDTTTVSSNLTTEFRRYIDLAQNINITVVPQGAGAPIEAQTRRYVFGGDSADAVVGGAKNDRLYGGGSADYLVGKGGNDYLEGGKGLDVYQYNGSTGLSGSSDDGADIIRDVDGKGVLRYTFERTLGFTISNSSTLIADASVKVGPNEWRSADGQFKFVRQSADIGDLTITILAPNNDPRGTITLKDFKDGDYNIHLREARPTPTAFNYTFRGDWSVRVETATVGARGTGAPVADPAWASVFTTGPAANGSVPVRYTVWVDPLTRTDVLRNAQGQPIEFLGSAPERTEPVIDSAQYPGAQVTSPLGGAATSYDITYTPLDSAGNIQRVANTADPQTSDHPYDTTGNDRMVLGANGDTVLTVGGLEYPQSGGGNDSISGGAGRDIMVGGAGQDLLEGGTDGDFGQANDSLFGNGLVWHDGAVITAQTYAANRVGGIGDDELYGDTKISLADAITQGASGAGSGLKGDFLTGGV